MPESSNPSSKDESFAPAVLAAPSLHATPSDLVFQYLARINGGRKVHPWLAMMIGACCPRSQIFAARPGQLKQIPYRTFPLADARRRFEKMPRSRQMVIGIPIQIFTTALLAASACATFSPTHGLPILGFMLALLCLPMSGLLFLCCYARDVMVSDQFGLAVHGSGFPVYWSDMDNLSIIDEPRHGKHRFFLKITCKSSRVLKIRIADLYPESLEPLCLDIEKNAPFCRNVSQLSELKRFRDFELGLLPGVTYTQLWESLTSKNMELTGFAPLKRGFALQDGRLRVLHQVASGGFSAVYLVENDEGIKYVLKEAILPFGVDEELVKKAEEQFEREAHILKSLNHPQIATVYDFFVEQGRKYMLLEYLPGETLKQIVYDNGPLPADKVVSYGIQVAALLSFLHNLPTPIIHRDIAPDNLIVSASGKLYLIDFGSANEFVGNATGTLVGKHAYMAPEQIRGRATPQSDIYALGQTIFYCIAGGAPAPLRSSHLQVAETKTEKTLDQVIRACTQLDAANRPRTVDEVITMLEAPFALVSTSKEA